MQKTEMQRWHQIQMNLQRKRRVRNTPPLTNGRVILAIQTMDLEEVIAILPPFVPSAEKQELQESSARKQNNLTEQSVK